MARQYLYRVTRVTGCMKKQLRVGEFVVDTLCDKSGHLWTVMSLKTAKITGTFYGEFVGQRTEALLRALRQAAKSGN